MSVAESFLMSTRCLPFREGAVKTAVQVLGAPCRQVVTAFMKLSQRRT